MATHSSVLAWRIPGTGEPHGLPSMGSRGVRHDWGALAAAAAADCSPSGFSVHGILQAKILEWVAMPSSRCMRLLLSHLSCVRLCATPETAAHQAPLSLGFSRQEHWSVLPFPSPMQESEK